MQRLSIIQSPNREGEAIKDFMKPDRIIIGTFSFQKLDFFTNSINSLFDKEVKINNEYYLDMAVNESISLGFKVDEVIVKNYISWGSHVELDEWKKNRSKTINR